MFKNFNGFQPLTPRYPFKPSSYFSVFPSAYFQTLKVSILFYHYIFLFSNFLILSIFLSPYLLIFLLSNRVPFLSTELPYSPSRVLFILLCSYLSNFSSLSPYQLLYLLILLFLFPTISYYLFYPPSCVLILLYSCFSITFSSNLSSYLDSYLPIFLSSYL